MLPEDEHARRREMERAVQARVLTESPLWDEAYSMLVHAEMERMLDRATPDEVVLECKRRILAINDIKRHFASVMKTGEMAEFQLKEAAK